MLTPLAYRRTFNAPIKAVIDKLYALSSVERGTKGKKYGRISCCAENGRPVFDDLRFVYGRAVAYPEGRSAGEVLVPGVTSAGGVERTDGIAQAKAPAERS